MADNAAVKDGDAITYVREDAGGAIRWGSRSRKRGWRLTPGETIIAGKTIPTDICIRLVEDGLCALVPPTANTPQTPTQNAPPVTAGGVAPGNSPSAPAPATTPNTTAPAPSSNPTATSAALSTPTTPAASAAASPSASSSAAAISS